MKIKNIAKVSLPTILLASSAFGQDFYAGLSAGRTNADFYEIFGGSSRADPRPTPALVRCGRVPVPERLAARFGSGPTATRS